MEITKTIKYILLMKDIKHYELAERLGYTKQGFSKALNKGDFKISDLEKIASALDYDLEIHFIDKKTGKVITF